MTEMSLKLTLGLIETSYATKARKSPCICAVVVKALELKSNSKLGGPRKPLILEKNIVIALPNRYRWERESELNRLVMVI